MKAITQQHRKTINLMTSCDDRLAKYTLPLLTSIGENLAQYAVNFYLFHNRIDPATIALIREYIVRYPNVNFQEVFIADSAPYEELMKVGGYWAYEAYFSLCCHKYLPKDVDRIMYVDAGDMMILGDVGDYYFTDFLDRSLIVTLGRCKENARAFDQGDLQDIEKLKVIKLGVFNSGCYILNVEKFREEGASMDDYIGMAHALRDCFPNESNVYFGDQGLLSAIFLGDIRYYAYPQTKNLWYIPYNFGLWFYNQYDAPWYEPKVVHFCGNGIFKPYQVHFSIDTIRKYSFAPDPTGQRAPFLLKPAQIEYYDRWWEYCKLTPVYDELNVKATSYARALEEHYLPLCARFNTLVDTVVRQQPPQPAAQKTPAAAIVK